MNSRSLQATLLFARHCVNSAKDAEKRRLFLAAHNLRKAAREALESVELADVTPVDPETARKREIARAYARTVVAGSVAWTDGNRLSRPSDVQVDAQKPPARNRGPRPDGDITFSI